MRPQTWSYMMVRSQLGVRNLRFWQMCHCKSVKSFCFYPQLLCNQLHSPVKEKPGWEDPLWIWDFSRSVISLPWQPIDSSKSSLFLHVLYERFVSQNTGSHLKQMAKVWVCPVFFIYLEKNWFSRVSFFCISLSIDLWWNF